MSYDEQMGQSNPWVPDKPPPGNLPEDYLREEIKSAKNGLGGLLIGGFTAGRTIQVFSRVPGTSGGIVTMLWLIGFFLQSYYLFGHREKYGEVDAIPYELFLLTQGAWWCVHLLCGFFGPRRSDYELGRGILCRFLPMYSHEAGGVISDVFVGMGLIGVLHLLDCPTQASTYYMILGLTLFCHVCVAGQKKSYELRLNAARKRAKNWHKDVRGGGFR